ncbi:unnamed protein product [Spirodela intermedia]|uniref:Uncharacterized protein n=1 Tax=Spirodela intermedia TaxID=51605 RepID=A0A7I8IVH6_SPIIN|nr:unnamed protein product [Spirodela intermedia]CAA6661632.1 unnamed protein product [Spirodela intermedia]
MESYIRPGCVVLSIYLSMSSLAWAKKLLDIFVEERVRKPELVQESLETLSEIQLLHRAMKLLWSLLLPF